MANRKSREIEQPASDASASSSSSEASVQAPKKSSRKEAAAAPAAAPRASKGSRSTKAETPAKGSSKRAAASAEAVTREKTRKVHYMLEAPEEGARDAPPTFVPVPDELSADELFACVKRTMGFMKTLVQSMNHLTEQVQGQYKRVVKDGNRKRNKRVADPNKAKTLSTFTFKMKVKPALLKFMNLPENSYVSRVEATEAITKYISANNLRVTDGPKKGTIKRDKALDKILAPSANRKPKAGDTSPPTPYDDVNSKNLQAFLSHNYLEKAPENAQPSIEDVSREQQRRAAEKAAKQAAKNEAKSRDSTPAAAPTKATKGSKAAPAAPAPEKKSRKSRKDEDASE